VHGWEEWGLDCLHRLRGMFAIAVWDDRSRELWLARDRMGIKPLHWTRRPDRFAFASEIKSLLADPAVERRVDLEALYHYLSFLTTPAPLTMFEGVRKLPAGGWLRVRGDGDLAEGVWWDPLEHVTPLTESEQTLAVRVLDELRTSVELR